MHQRLLALMFDLLVESQSPLVSNTVGSVFKAVSRRGQAACAGMWLSPVKDRLCMNP